MENNEKPKKDSQGQRPKRSFNFYWIYGIIVVMILAMGLFNFNSHVVRIDISEYDNYLANGDVQGIEVKGDAVLVTIMKDSLIKEVHEKKLAGTSPEAGAAQYTFYIGNTPQMQQQVIEEARAKKVDVRIDPQNDMGKEILNWVLFFGAIALVWMFMMRRMGGPSGPGGQIFNIGKSRAQVFEGGKSTDITFNDVAGLEEAKEELQEIVDFLKTPKKYTDLGAKIPKGALLVGPPGTGKTLLAKAIAGEAEVPFFSLSGSDFVEMFVGVGASRVRDLFKQAKEKAPSIIFIDEIDAIGRARGRNVNMGSNDERENTLNQLLTEMDGFGTNTGVILIGATNRADVLDRALLRPGRFDRQIFVDMPDLNERIAIFKVHLKPLKMDIAVDVEFLARQTPGFSGADIANICNEAALIAARRKKTSVEKQDFLDAVDRVIGGLEKKNKIITTEEKRAIAYHEAGHATVSWLVEHASPLVKVTIVPRGRSLGAAWYLPDERHLTTTEQMLDEICAAMGGRAAEDLIYGKVSTGALSDLEKVTKQATAMVTVYGLNDKIGNISFYDSTGQSEYSFGKPYSEHTARMIDEEVRNIVEVQYVRAKRILTENKDKLTALATQLLEKEVIFKEDLEKIFGNRPFAPQEQVALTQPQNGNGGKTAPEPGSLGTKEDNTSVA
ncbi:MAG TPA: ATP-dependent zinc metalloprotease FtsH [Flavobacteriales bacterium]|nr:ATP-dependent zinc metalloprotease FtsH [Flavobacteriales bacterium]HQW33400.1 ATP-dependent zinc metalloprotease FtsH [Flavobacteriales bacterium]HQY03634.1 ATP-dependent zinc metalloprotease FtsH [Flavobacteriales bacterium]HQY80423.1 ATP-dependent zinc metalloprotease FtsH [Flavobacteriales bacterium]